MTRKTALFSKSKEQYPSTYNIMTCSVFEIISLNSEVLVHWYFNLSLLLNIIAGVTTCESRAAWYCFLRSMKWLT